jgi:hypothetical protein
MNYVDICAKGGAEREKEREVISVFSLFSFQIVEMCCCLPFYYIQKFVCFNLLLLLLFDQFSVCVRGMELSVLFVSV